jgi:hypothetical protein
MLGCSINFHKLRSYSCQNDFIDYNRIFEIIIFIINIWYMLLLGYYDWCYYY